MQTTIYHRRCIALLLTSALFGLAVFPRVAAGELTADDFDIEGLPQQQYSLDAVYNNAAIDRIDVAGSVGYVIKPTHFINSRREWVWIAPLWLALPSNHGSYIARNYVQSLLNNGYHVAGFDVGASLGSPKGAEVFAAFQDQVVADYNLAPKARMLAVSNGGLIAYGYAFRNPGRVDRIAGIYPALDFTSWPQLHLVVGPSAITPAGLAYDLTPPEMLANIELYNPIDNLAPLAASNVPILHLHGDADAVVPMNPNSTIALQRYTQLGGQMQVTVLPGFGHGGAEFFSSTQLLTFLMQPSVAGLDGDFDGDGVVDAADYVVWRKMNGTSFHLNGNANDIGVSAGVVDQADYVLWQSNFGDPAGGGGSSILRVPEPHSLLLVLVAILSIGLLFRV
jgi:hypothetical protein